MKKILAVVLALTMIVGMSIPAFAAEVDTNYEVDAIGESKSFEVAATYTFNESDATIYGVNISWTEISFEYKVDQGSWDPDTLDYKTDDQVAGWIDADQTTTITVENRSNAAIKATATWTDGAFDEDVVTIGDPITLASAVGVGDAANAAQTDTIAVTVNLTGKTIAKSETVGTIVVTITAA